ncbi:spore protease YyaC [Paenibacillus oenotherae]|uniref:Spore protease YyaC n=1 Tax=Paenibacillus oenotherae TaxID=1435645 RepID=A0ABS7DC89_9BACL|nr:spore protease YyaC [Paenibacillus oenotherae]MBW7476768.1 spore protease YyaC [Paenibacillus oenotherae]
MGSGSRTRKFPADEQGANRRWIDSGGLHRFFADIAAAVPRIEELAFVCIGTDCSTGDSFGPWIGTLLRERGVPHVIGTLHSPCDADRYEEAIASIPDTLTIVAIDASLGHRDRCGLYLIDEGPLYPARATGRRLPPIGHYSVAGVVGPLNVKPYWSLQRASIYKVVGMARAVADAACAAWGIPVTDSVTLRLGE